MGNMFSDLNFKNIKVEHIDIRHKSQGPPKAGPFIFLILEYAESLPV